GTATETPARWSLTRHFVLIIKSATGFTRQNSMSIRWTVICDARNASWKRRRMIKSAGRCAGNCGIWMTGCFARDVTCTTQNAAFTASPTSDKDRPIRLWEQKISGAAGGSRTPDLRLRRPVLYPAELLPHAMKLRHFTVAAAKHQTGPAQYLQPGTMFADVRSRYIQYSGCLKADVTFASLHF